mgnify:CR=1 FL=1
MNYHPSKRAASTLIDGSSVESSVVRARSSGAPALYRAVKLARDSSLRRISVKYAALLVVPAAAIIALSKPAISTLLGKKYTSAPLYLTLIGINYLYSAFGSLSLGSLINSQGKTRATLKLTLVTATIGFPLSLLLIPKHGVTGLIITTLTAGIPSLIISRWYVKKQFTATVDWKSSAKILLASTLAAAITYTIISQLSLPNWIKLIIGATIFLTTYAISAPLIGAINKTDIQNLRETLKELGPLAHIFNLLLNIIEKLLLITQKA